MRNGPLTDDYKRDVLLAIPVMVLNYDHIVKLAYNSGIQEKSYEYHRLTVKVKE